MFTYAPYVAPTEFAGDKAKNGTPLIIDLFLGACWSPAPKKVAIVGEDEEETRQRDERVGKMLYGLESIPPLRCVYEQGRQ